MLDAEQHKQMEHSFFKECNYSYTKIRKQSDFKHKFRRTQITQHGAHIVLISQKDYF